MNNFSLNKVCQVTGALMTSMVVSSQAWALRVEAPELHTPVADSVDHHAAEAVGLPQLNAETYASQTFWLVVFFILLYVLMSRVALPRVSEVIDLRDSEITGNLSRAEKFQTEMEDVKASYEESLAKAHDDAAQTLKKIEDKVAKKVSGKQELFATDAKDRLAKSEQNIEKAKAEALKSLEDIAADITKDALKAIAGITVKKADALKQVKSTIKGAA
tara:strand:+ start:221 stop:871 length:651 start_codon:yes stop_codon:yes gene_type:complete